MIGISHLLFSPRELVVFFLLLLLILANNSIFLRRPFHTFFSSNLNLLLSGLFVYLSFAIYMISVSNFEDGLLQSFVYSLAFTRNICILILFVPILSFFRSSKAFVRFISLIASFYYSLLVVLFYQFNSFFSFGSSRIFNPGIIAMSHNNVNRFMALHYDPNFCAMLALIPFVYLLSSGISSLASKYSLLIVSLSISLTGSRSGIALMLFILVFYYMCPYSHRFCFSIRRFKLLSLIAFLGSFSVFFLVRPSLDMINGRSDYFDLFAQRISNYVIAAKGVDQNFFFGNGVNYVFRVYGKVSHSDILDSLASFGLIGSFLFFFFLASFALSLLIFVFRFTNLDYCPFVIALVSLAVYIPFFSIVANDFFVFYLLSLLWISVSKSPKLLINSSF